MMGTRGTPSSAIEDVLLDVRDLSTHYFTAGGVVRAVDDVSFKIAPGQTIGLVGESGCGKSNIALSICRLVTAPGRIVGGEINFAGRDLLKLNEREMRRVRGREIGYVFQDPMTSLNPLHQVGRQLRETIMVNLGLNRRAADERAAELLHKVGIAKPRERMKDYPHQFSGGMRQRVIIAIALACDPLLLLADEPTTALDVTIQAQILELLQELSQELRTSVLLITHDLGIAAGMCDRIIVMYAGQIVEEADTRDIFSQPEMPYTRGLLDSLPQAETAPQTLLPTIEGMPPTAIDEIDSCRFAPRCPHVREICREATPELNPRHSRPLHRARCAGTDQGGWLNGI